MLLSLVALVLLAPPPPAAPAAPPTAAPDGRWILHLADGRVHRGPVRETDEGYLVRGAEGWEPVARSAVVRAVREDEALAAVRERRRQAGGDLEARVGAAQLALEEGLLPEFVAELDSILAEDPDLAPARELIGGAPLALTLPATSERTLAARLVLFGARAKPAYRELAAARLAGLPREEVLVELERGVRSPSATVRAFTAFALRRIDPAAQKDALVRRAVVDPSEAVRLEAARALRDAHDESLGRRVAAALELGDPRLRTFAARSLGEMGYAAAVPALAARLAAAANDSHPGGTRGHITVGNQVAYVQDFDPEIAQGASIGDPIVDVVEEATVLDVRVGGTSTQRVWREVPELCRALDRLTGAGLPAKPAPWLAWWEANRERYRGGNQAPATGD